MMKVYVCDVTIYSTVDSGTEPAMFRFYSSEPAKFDTLTSLQALCSTVNLSVKWENYVRRVDSADDLSRHVLSTVHQDVIIKLKRQDPDLQPGATLDPNFERMNNIEHAVRNQGRSINALGDAIKDLVNSVGSLIAREHGARAANDAATRIAEALPGKVGYEPADGLHIPPTVLPQPVDEPLTDKQRMAMQAGKPLVGTPSGWAGGQDAMSTPLNPRSHGGSATPEMASGQMQVHGYSPRVLESGTIVGIDDKGEPIVERFSLPKVGDTLRPTHLKSDL